MIKKLTILLGLLALVGCSSLAQKAKSSLTTGMSQEEVESIMGSPTKKLGSEWYYFGDHDLILRFDDKGVYQSFESSAPDPSKRLEPSEAEKRLQEIRTEENRRAVESFDMTRGYQ